MGQELGAWAPLRLVLVMLLRPLAEPPCPGRLAATSGPWDEVDAQPGPLCVPSSSTRMGTRRRATHSS